MGYYFRSPGKCPLDSLQSKKMPLSCLLHVLGFIVTVVVICLVVIVGAGGCSAAYFLNDLMGDVAKVDVYSNDKIGGRIAVVEYGGKQYEAGASILHKDNLYMAGFATKFGT